MKTNDETVGVFATLTKYGADVLFVVQVIGGLGLIIPMMIRNWHTVEGVSLSFFLVLMVFCALQASLAIPAYRAQPSRKAAQAIAIYILWIVLVALHATEIAYRGMYVWSTNDTITIIVTGVSALGVYLWRRWRGSSFNDPDTKSQLGMTTRGIPQLLQGVKIAMVGGAGLPAVSVVVGNLNIWIRIFHLVLTREEAKWEQNRIWMLATEIVNAVSWGIVSLIWLAWRIGLINPN